MYSSDGRVVFDIQRGQGEPDVPSATYRFIVGRRRIISGYLRIWKIPGPKPLESKLDVSRHSSILVLMYMIFGEKAVARGKIRGY